MGDTSAPDGTTTVPTTYHMADVWEAVSERVPDRVAVVCGEVSRTYAELEARANQLAHALAQRGVGAGDHVGIYLTNSHEYLETMLAAFKLRAVPINVNYRYVADELRYLFDDADLVALVHDVAYAPRVAAVAGDVETLRHFVAMPGPPLPESVELLGDRVDLVGDELLHLLEQRRGVLGHGQVHGVVGGDP